MIADTEHPERSRLNMFLGGMGATLFLFGALSISPMAQSQAGSEVPGTNPVVKSVRGRMARK